MDWKLEEDVGIEDIKVVVGWGMIGLRKAGVRAHKGTHSPPLAEMT